MRLKLIRIRRFYAVGCAGALVLTGSVACTSTTAPRTGTSNAPASSGASSSSSGSSDTLTVALDREPSTLDPQKVDDNGKDFVTWRINEGLVDFDHNGKVVPSLASDLPTMDPKDPTKWTIDLRTGIKFTDGEPLNAAAVVANVKRITDPKFGSSYVGAELESLESATALSATKVQFQLKNPDPEFDYELRSLRIVPPEYAQDDAKMGADPVGTGPYEFVSWTHGSEIRLTANPHYWAGTEPQYKNIDIKIVPDEGTRLQALQSGEVDIATDLSPSDAGQVPQLITAKAGVEVQMLRFNYTTKPYSDPRFRQALNYAIDKNGLSKALFGGLFPAANCELTPAQAIGSDPALKPYPYDPAKAKQLLAEAGASGATINVDWTNGIFSNDREEGQAVAAMWEAIGLKVNMTFNDGPVFVKKIYEKGASSPDMIYTETDTSFNQASRVASILYAGSGAAAGNIGSVDPQFQTMVTKAASDLNPTMREATYKQLQDFQCQNAMFVYLLVRKDTYGAKKCIQYDPRPELFAKFYFDEVKGTC